MGATLPFLAQAPARVCLFGDHQDYLGLPIIASPINLFLKINGSSTSTGSIELVLHNINKTRLFELDQLAQFQPQKGDHAAWVLKVLSDRSLLKLKGAKLEVYSQIPINAGLSSSSAFIVALIRAFHALAPFEGGLSPQRCAELAYEAEVLRQVGPGGKMDQFTIAYEHCIFLEMHEGALPQPIHKPKGCWVIGDSGQAKDTLGVLGQLRQQGMQAFQRIKALDPDFQPKHTPEEAISSYSEALPQKLRPIFEAGICNYHITKRAKEVLMQKDYSLNTLGSLLNAHHKQLKKNLGLTTPLIDAMVNEALMAGAKGAKIVGSGGGGCILALCEAKEVQSVVKAIKAAGAKSAFACKLFDQKSGN